MNDKEQYFLYACNSCFGQVQPTKCQIRFFLLVLGVRSLANASRARQFNPLNPPGVGWVIYIFFKVIVSIRTCVPNLGAVRHERLLTIDNPPKPPWGGVGQILSFFKVRVSISTCVPNLARSVAKDF